MTIDYYTMSCNHVNCTFLNITSHFRQNLRKKNILRVLPGQMNRSRAITQSKEDGISIALCARCPLHIKATLQFFKEVLRPPPPATKANHVTALLSIGGNHMVAIRVGLKYLRLHLWPARIDHVGIT